MNAASTTKVSGVPSPSYLPADSLALGVVLLRRRSRSSLLVVDVLGDVLATLQARVRMFLIVSYNLAVAPSRL